MNTELEIIKIILNNPAWPNAVDPELIANSEDENDKESRALGIIANVLTDIDINSESKFLDIGCGEGHLAKEISTISNGKIKTVGYDLVQSGTLNWENQEGYLLTTDFEKVVQNGPYDNILIYDVIDHTGDQVDILIKSKKVSHEKTKIRVRFHPWCSRHGTHIYKKINKAFIHLVLSEEELTELGYAPEIYTVWNNAPLLTYQKIINNAGLKIINERIESDPVEHFFEKEFYLKNRIMQNMKNTKELPLFQMQQSFVDYILSI